MRLGLIAYATTTGLGYQTKSFYDNLNPTKTLLVDLSKYNKMPINHTWYPNARYCAGFPKSEDIEWLTTDIDVIIECETPLNYDLHKIAAEKQVKVLQLYNREFLDYFRNPQWAAPSLLASPTSWCIEEVRNLGVAPTEILRQPIDLSTIPYREITHLETFVHIIGRPTVHDRNGTIAFLEAANFLGNRFKYKIFMQEPEDERAIEFFQPVREVLNRFDGLAEIILNVEDNKTMYESGDVLVLPRRYGGLCLPMLEALASGMPVVMPDISPNRDILPKEWLCEASYGFTYRAHTNWEIYDVNVSSLANTMRRFEQDSEIVWANRKALNLAKSQSWDTLKPVWEQRLCELCR